MSDPLTTPASTPPAPVAKGEVVPSSPAAGGGATAATTKTSEALDPTRYGDWEKNGRCIDF